MSRFGLEILVILKEHSATGTGSSETVCLVVSNSVKKFKPGSRSLRELNLSEALR